MGIVSDLVQRYQLVGKRIGGVLLRLMLVLEANGVVQIGSLRHRMMAQRVEVWRHRVDGSERGIG